MHGLPGLPTPGQGAGNHAATAATTAHGTGEAASRPQTGMAAAMECRLFWPPIWNRGGNSLSLPCRRSGNVSPFFVHSGMDGRKRLSEDGFQGCERPWMGGRKATFESVKGHVWERERPWAGARGAVPATARRRRRHPKATHRTRRAVVFSYDFQLFPRPGNRPRLPPMRPAIAAPMAGQPPEGAESIAQNARNVHNGSLFVHFYTLLFA